MRSNESAGAKSELFAAITTRVMENAIQQGVDAGIRAGIEYIDEEKKRARKDRYDRRLHNTRLLLKNYRLFKKHAQGAIYSAKQARESAIDVLDGLDTYTFNDNLYIESIRTSQQRTLVILEHLAHMMRYYKIDCTENGNPEDLRRYNVVMATYINEPKMSPDEIAGTFGIDRRTIYKDINAALKPLTALFFGIDSLKTE